MSKTYTPDCFSINDINKEIDFIRRQAFGTLISNETNGELVLSKAPFLLKEYENKMYLEGHLAAVNPHIKVIKKQSLITVTFDGPHSYISPLWYELPEKSVPTWNYSSVIVQGKVELIDSETWLLDSVLELTRKYESNLKWEESIDMNLLRRLTQGIIGLKILITNIKGKFKLSQNKTEKTRQQIIGNLEEKNKLLAHEMKIL